MQQEILRQIPKMDKLLARPAIRSAIENLPAAYAKLSLQQSLDALRKSLLRGEKMPTEQELDEMLLRDLKRQAEYSLRPVVNATGIVLHTNLGRAPLGEEIAQHLVHTAAGYSNLEYDLKLGKRGNRTDAVEALLCKVTGAEAALVVNNNAAAAFLMLHALACGKQTAVSRGELVEIGGSFRVPEIMAQSGAILSEVGTTNKTHLYDYEHFLKNNESAVLLKVHTSNFRITGFTEEVPIEQLQTLAEQYHVPLLYDLGAGWLTEPELLGLHCGISVQKCVKSCDVLCFSGDKLLGGTQAGILLGKKEYINKIKHDQLVRMLRVDKLTLCALEAVVRLYLSPEQAVKQIPLLQMCGMKSEELREKAQLLAKAIQSANENLSVKVISCEDAIGGGSMPGVTLPGFCVEIVSDAYSAQQFDQALRQSETPIVGLIRHDAYCLSVRTLMKNDEKTIQSAFEKLEIMP